jgi:hypothetical protein
LALPLRGIVILSEFPPIIYGDLLARKEQLPQIHILEGTRRFFGGALLSVLSLVLKFAFKDHVESVTFWSIHYFVAI